MTEENPARHEAPPSILQIILIRTKKILTLSFVLTSMAVISFLVAILSFVLDRSESIDSTKREINTESISTVSNILIHESMKEQARNHNEIMDRLNQLYQKDLNDILDDFIMVATDKERELVFTVRNGSASDVKDSLIKLAELSKRKEEANRIIVEDMLQTYKVVGAAAASTDPHLAIEYFEKAMSLSDEDWQLAYNLGELYIAVNNYEKAIYYYKKGVEIIGVNNGFRAAGYRSLGGIEFNVGNFDTAFDYYYKGTTIDFGINMVREVVVGLTLLGLTEENRGNIDAAEMWYLRSISAATEGNYASLVAMSQLRLAFISYDKNDLESYENYLIESLNSSRKAKDSAMIAQSLMYLGGSKYIASDYVAAEQYFLESEMLYTNFPVPLSDKDQESLLHIYSSLRTIYMFNLVNFKSAARVLNLRIDMLKETNNDTDSLISSLEDLAYSTFLGGNIEKACDYWSEAISLTVLKSSEGIKSSKSTYDSYCVNL